MFDISLVLNCHNEDLFINATLKSLDLCFVEANKAGLSVELVCVLDRPTLSIEKKIDSFRFRSSIFKKVIVVNNASLGLSRNDGINASSGEFVCTADADDLISKNWLVESYKAAKEYFDYSKCHCVVVSEYVYSFGNVISLQRYFGSKYFSPCDIIAYNPFSSRVFAHRSVFIRIPYQNLDKNSGFAYEDWDFNVRAYYYNVEFITSDKTILFYRRRDDSIMAQTDYVKLIPYSKLFSPVELVNRQLTYRRPKDFSEIINSNVKAFSKTPAFLEAIKELASIEPDISLNNHEFTKNTDLVWRHYGYSLFDLFKKTQTYQFDCIIYLSNNVSDREVEGVISFVNKIANNKKLGGCLLVADFPTERLNSIFSLIPVLDLESFQNDLTKTTQDIFKCRLLLSLLKTGGHLVTDAGRGVFINHYRKSLSSKIRLISLDEFLCLSADQINQIFASTNRETWWKSPIQADKERIFILPKLVKFFSNSPRLFSALKRIYRNRFVYKLAQNVFRHDLE